MTRAFAYLRVSGAAQVDGDGFDRQLAAIERYARSAGIEIARVFREEGVSGTKDLEHRPAFLEMLDSLNGVRTIVIERLDRLARDLMIQESILRDMKNRDVQVISATEPDLCDEDPSRKLFRQILGAFAEYEKTMIVAKLRVARQRQKDRTGRCEGTKPYGHYPGEAEVRDRILAWGRDGVSARQIGLRLDAEGVRTRSGQHWHPYTVRRILLACGVNVLRGGVRKEAV